MLELIDIRKRFGDLRALDGVSVRVGSGRVHGLLGENGAGKSTLMNVAYGMLAPDDGQIRMNGAPVALRSPRDAIAEGIGMVHQHFMLAGALSVLDNVLLGDQRAGRILNRGRAANELSALANRLGWPLDPLARVERLSVGQQQRVESLKALWRDARVLILDEPTAVLTPPEVEQLFGAVERMRDEGRSVVFISHKLAEVKRICDDLTVLRRGRVVWEGRANEVSATELASLMIGREVPTLPQIRGTSALIQSRMPEENADYSAKISADVPLIAGADSSGAGKLSGLPVAVKPGAVLACESVLSPGLQNISLHIAPGEILGIAGVDGNGQQELAEIVVGLRRISTGRITFSDRDVTGLSFHDRLALGVAHIPNDRKLEALVPAMTITENIVLKRHDRPPLSRGGIMSWHTAASVAQDLTQRFDIRAPSTDASVASLSGGNQQKVVLARELAMAEPKLIVATNPVRGLDVAATNFVYQELLARRAAGAAILLISSELDELLVLCDRIAVLYAGRLTMTDFPTIGRDQIGRLMAGIDFPSESR